MKIKWIWNKEDFKSFPHLKENELEVSLAPGLYETPEDMMWAIATAVYGATGVVVPSETCIRAHVPELDAALKKFFG